MTFRIKDTVSAGDLEILLALYQSRRGWGELARMFEIKNPSEYIGRLEDKGLAEINPDSIRGSNDLYQITSLGREFLEKLRDEIHEIR